MAVNTWAKNNIGGSSKTGASGSESSGGESVVTFVMDNTEQVKTGVFEFPVALETEGFVGTYVYNEELGGGLQEMKVPLYKGKALVMYRGEIDETFQLSGGIEVFDEGEDYTVLVITGDCELKTELSSAQST